MVIAFLAMMPKLSAEEAIQRTHEAGIAKTLKPGGWAQRMLNRWSTQAKSDPGADRRAVPATHKDLRSIGIGVRVVKSGRR